MRVTKSIPIIELLEYLSIYLGPNDYQIVDHWDGDLCAIGIASCRDKHHLVYISTYEQPRGSYYFECEKSLSSELSECTITKQGNLVDLQSLITVIQQHLDLK